MMNEVQMKMLPKGFFPNRAWIAIITETTVSTHPYLNRRQRNQIKLSKKKKGK